MTRLDDFLSYSLGNKLIKEQPLAPRPGLVFDKEKHRWVTDAKAGEQESTSSNLGRWNKVKSCPKCNFSKKVISGSPKDMELNRCPKCGVKLKQSHFSPNF